MTSDVRERRSYIDSSCIITQIPAPTRRLRRYVLAVDTVRARQAYLFHARAQSALAQCVRSPAGQGPWEGSRNSHQAAPQIPSASLAGTLVLCRGRDPGEKVYTGSASSKKGWSPGYGEWLSHSVVTFHHVHLAQKEITRKPQN